METVAAYLRNSSKQQEQSISRQKAELIAYADSRGYKLIWYIDKDVSGNKTKKRPQFLKMIDDCDKQLFSRILVWDSHRFARLNILDGAKYKLVLKDNAIKLESMKDGVIDYTKRDDRLKDAFNAEQGEDYLADLSRGTVSGRHKYFEQGWWVTGTIPYGYDRVYCFDGKETLIPRNARYSKGRHEHLKLIVNEDERPVVKEIFERISHTKTTFNELIRDLAKRGIMLSKNVIQDMIRNPVYYGNNVLGKPSKRLAGSPKTR